ncbi:efflux RND transporter permease subunit [Burkholderia ubonensis]|uniref:efflux RND transporter permease subunit n=1 Tax=Burkholderia ubonensis TaxID=101571 RepID=UPI000BA6AE9F|nr:efflux RND transporter permease subunit [Burkholderia ubonensis]PAJ86086.1 hydrophobe/amphiphile efflux-1 family RND transporter [Burkholderia ubonensis]PAJ93051.1 hydrophobe/amphiphile efflux-1 family RND transporter [Burkholderia ubonensis]PAK05583.1 hydrophobe/amphiphile efflux-1 family RND transporter [Burkholderia ubonensis]RQP68235.1 hydrophobe/amphiphile efflux-1 family RND transporter [Burkholderia ubonensis]RQP84834.1 hydrophobe/amphiphile efflux-1 family RND transporter [Burkholde
MARFFIQRPILAWVIAIVIMLVGAAAMTTLPVEQYPTIAPPSVRVTATYPGASADTIAKTVTQVIEQKLSGIDNLMYVSSTSSNAGQATITLTFAPGTNPDIAQVQVQNKVTQASASLPETVQEQGVQVAKATDAFLLIVALSSPGGSLNSIDLGNVIATQIEDPLTQLTGVGDVTLFGAEHAMRIWLNPVQLKSVGLTASDVTTAITNQNVQLSVGELGGAPATGSQAINATISSSSLLTTPEQFGDILLRVNTDGSKVRLRDVARVEVGGDSYATSSRLDGKPTAALAIKLSTGANAMSTASKIRAKLAELQPQLPKDVVISYPYDSTPFVRISIEEVVKTLIEAVILVFLVMYLFLQNLRATLIPTIVVPVALLGTMGVMSVIGFSINVLSMFAMVLAIGLLVDDAIVVVENVERIMTDEQLDPKAATTKAMGQITGALIGVTMVLTAVFIPMAFFSGSTGAIYRQFSVTIVSAMVLSVLLAMTLTPALCATLLAPASVLHQERKGFLGAFNRLFARGNTAYSKSLTRVVAKPARWMIAYALVTGVVGLLFATLPSAYLPEEDQGSIMVTISAPVGTPASSTLKTVEAVEQYFLRQPAVAHVMLVNGFSFNGQGQNNAFAFVQLKDWSQRGSDSAQAVIRQANAVLLKRRDARIFVMNPPAIQGLGTQSGLDFEIEDRSGLGHERLLSARNQFMALAAKSPYLAMTRPGGLEDTPQLYVDIDREKASALGLSISDVDTTLSTAFGSSYVNNYIDTGRIQKVYVQADAPYRMMPSDIGQWYVRADSSSSSSSNSSSGTSTTSYDGEMVPFSAFSTTRWTFGPPQIERYNRALAMQMSSQTRPGVSTGQAMNAVEKLAQKLPPGIGIEWTGQSYQEKLAGSQAIYLYAISLLVVFLCLAGLYESWSVPLAVILVVPVGVLGALVAAHLRGLENDVYFKVGLLTTIGLSTKNAILIVEFAKELQAQGRTLIDATLEAAHLRLRPILMTSLAFVFGVLPLVISTGAGSAARHAIGTGVAGGMIAATVLAIFFVPVFFVVVRTLFKEHGDNDARQAGEGA